MPAGDYILALDLGTTSGKALAVAGDGTVIAQRSGTYGLHQPRDGWSEQDPDEIVNVAHTIVARVIADVGTPPRAAAMSCYMHSMIALDRQGRPLTRCWTWADQRAADVAAALHASGRARELHARTGTPVHAMSPLCKLMWLRDHDPATFGRTATFSSLKDYLLAGFGAEPVIDHSVASSSGLFDIHDLDWHAAALQLARIDAERLPHLVPTRHIVEGRSGDLAGVPIVVGATDGVLANLGAGATGPGQLAVTLGTSGAARQVVTKPVVDPNQRLFCYVLDDQRWVLGGAVNNAGLALQWLARTTGSASAQAPTEMLAEIAALCETVPPGAAGLLCLPLLAGERFAAWQPESGGMFAGLGNHHTRAHMARALLEGVLSLLTVVADAVASSTTPRVEVRIGGGIAAAPVVRQMAADMLCCDVAMPASEQSSALGAARLAMAAMGDDDDWADEVAHRHTPNAGVAAAYREVRLLIEQLYANNHELLARLATLR